MSEAAKKRHSYAMGYLIALFGSVMLFPADDSVIATLTDGMLYIEKAPAVQNSNILEVQ